MPLSEPIQGLNGELMTEILVPKETSIIVGIRNCNRSKALWGEDALEFKPERWDHPVEAISNIPGVWGNILSFLGGPRSCIGYRFTLVESVSSIGLALALCSHFF